MTKIDIGSLNVYYETDGDGEPLVFIHGLGSSTVDWDEQVAAFKNKFRVLRYDVRGHGQTDKPSGRYSVPLFAQDLAKLLDRLGINEAHIVGFSMGGWIAFQFAVDHPDRVKSLTIVNSGPELMFNTWKKKKQLWTRLILFRLFNMKKIGEVLAPKMFIKPEQEEIRQKFIERWAKNHKPAYMASFQGSVNWSVMDQIDKITCPILVVAADEDYTPVSEKQEYAAKLSNAKLIVIEDSRHATPVERPDEFNSTVLSFLEGLRN